MLAARKVPVIMVKGDITASQLKQARNAGVHEVLKRPFAWQDLLTRLRNVVFKPREWIDAAVYVGPDRRRFNTGGDYTGARKRKGEPHNTAYVAIEEAVRLMRAAITAPDIASEVLHKTLLDQMSVIVPNAKHITATDFIQTVGQLVAAMRTGNISAERMEPIINNMVQQLNLPTKVRAGWANKLLEENVTADVFLLDGDSASHAA